MAVAKEAQKGTGMDKLVEFTHQALKRSHFISYFDTLKYLARGGRIGNAQGLLGSVLSIKPILAIKAGEMSPVTRVRSLATGTTYLHNFIKGFKDIEAIGIETNMSLEKANELAKLLSNEYPTIPIVRSTISPVLGVYSGPNALAVTVLEKRR